MELIFKEEAYAVFGSCFEVYNEMGCGFLEAVYQECLELELKGRNLPFRPRADLTLTYKGQVLKQIYIPDFICFEKIILEIKAVSQLASTEHRFTTTSSQLASGSASWSISVTIPSLNTSASSAE